MTERYDVWFANFKTENKWDRIEYHGEGCMTNEAYWDLLKWCDKYRKAYPNPKNWFSGFVYHHDRTLIGYNFTAKQLEKFIMFDVKVFKQEFIDVQIKHKTSSDGINFDGEEYWTFDNQTDLPFIDELEKSKWNPRSVLGKLEFDRRLVEDGIEFFD